MLLPVDNPVHDVRIIYVSFAVGLAYFVLTKATQWVGFPT
jgi:hypothetical protein